MYLYSCFLYLPPGRTRTSHARRKHEWPEGVNFRWCLSLAEDILRQSFKLARTFPEEVEQVNFHISLKTVNNTNLFTPAIVPSSCARCKYIFHRFKICYTLTHWGRVAHIWFSKLVIIGYDNGLSPGRHQAIILTPRVWTTAAILSIRILGINSSEIFIEIHTFSFKKMHLKISSGKWQPFCLDLKVSKPCAAPLIHEIYRTSRCLLMSQLLGHQQE